jgi:nitrogenase subunit NifH
MTKVRKIGIWMDHANAHIMEYTTDSIETSIITSPFTHQVKEESIQKGESLMHNKEQHQQAEYYKKIGAEILKYETVVLFGPTDAKVELHNILKADHRFDDIKIDVQPADKMTEHQEQAFVKTYFSKGIF